MANANIASFETPDFETLICLDSDMKTKYGLLRLYNIELDSFEFGSWLYSRNAPMGASVLGDIFCHSLAFNYLNFKICTMQTRKLNTTVLKYTLTYDPEIINEDDFNYYFKLDYEKWVKRKNELLKLLNYGK